MIKDLYPTGLTGDTSESVCYNHSKWKFLTHEIPTYTLLRLCEIILHSCPWSSPPVLHSAHQIGEFEKKVREIKVQLLLKKMCKHINYFY